MKIVIYLLFFIFCCGTMCYAQDRFVCLDLHKVTGFKRIKYYPGDEIRFKSKLSGKKYKGTIVALTDSTIVFKNNLVIPISEISVVYRDNGTFVNKGLGRFCLVFGPGFIALDTFNNLINGRETLVNDVAVKEGAAFTGAGLILTNMLKKRYKIGKRKSLKILDLSLTPASETPPAEN